MALHGRSCWCHACKPVTPSTCPWCRTGQYCSTAGQHAPDAPDAPDARHSAITDAAAQTVGLRLASALPIAEAAMPPFGQPFDPITMKENR